MNWIIVTIFAAFFQNLRSSIQKKLNKEVSTIASTYVRFAFALPLATILFFIYFRNFEIIEEILRVSKSSLFKFLAYFFVTIFCIFFNKSRITYFVVDFGGSCR